MFSGTSFQFVAADIVADIIPASMTETVSFGGSISAEDFGTLETGFGVALGIGVGRRRKRDVSASARELLLLLYYFFLELFVIIVP